MIDVTLTAKNIVKHYGGVVALADADFHVQSGEVVALIGANGSGKSTLGKIITGVVSPDEGQLLIDGEPTRLGSPIEARRLGITAVYQELSLVPDMTVAENIWLGHEPLTWYGRVNARALERRTEELLDLFSGTVQRSLHPSALIRHLPPDEKQIVEILKAISQEPRLIILDEATASLDSQQVARLFELVGDWKAQGHGIVFVTHRMEEIFRVADRATVLRSGKTVGDVVVSETSAAELVQLMIADTKPPAERVRSNGPEVGDLRLQVSGLSTDGLQEASLELRDGELLGLGGLKGQGQEELLLAIFGAIPFKGHITLSGQDVHFNHPREAMKHDVAFVPGERATEGLLLSRSILENLHLPTWRKYGLPLDMQEARQNAQEVSNQLQLVMDSLEDPVSSLSGGNAQKVVLGKWLLRSPKLLLLNDPTKGVDVGAKGEFYQLLNDLRRAGTAVMFYSSDDDELLNLCDRVLVLHDGRIVRELAGDDLTHSNLVAASLGTLEGETP
ncbi:MAG: sugar ABC transporter ATP-binding protein [Chloroflexota bacterium]